MPDVKYERDTQLFNCTGIDVNRPVDSTKPGKFPYIKNGRSYISGRIEPRLGLTDIDVVVSGQSSVHSARRLNDPLQATWTRVVGAGTHLAYGQSSFTDIDSGYSGKPLALQPWQPLNSPGHFMYVGDSLRMRKLDVLGNLDTIGYAAPTNAPTVALTNSPAYKVIDEFDATAGWGQAGTAGAPSLLSAGPGYRTTGTISQILFDTSTTGWASVNLSSMVGVAYGERLNFNPGGGADEVATVQAVFPGSVATTIASIIYDSGTSGLCSIVLTTPIEQVAVDALIRNTTVGPENARIVAVAKGPDGTTSIRVSTSGTWAATNAIQVLSSFRVYLVNNHAAGETVRTDGVRTSVTVGIGTLTRTVALDLSLFSTGIAVQQDDYMCISLRVDRPDLVTELKVQLDVDSATNDFTRNFYSRTFRSSDLTPSVRNAQPIISTRAQVIQRDVIEQPVQENQDPQFLTGAFPASVTTPSDSSITISQQLESGDVQWVPLRFRISDLMRIGTDDTRTLANVAAIRIIAIVTGTVAVDMDSWWIGGGYGPDTGDMTAVPYLYRYRVRNPATNVPSNFSPATRLELSPFRQQVTITPTQYAAPSGTTLAATDLVLDIERFGGLIAQWHYVATIANSASPTFTDNLADDLVVGNPALENDNYQPWPIKGAPRSGQTGTVAGTSVNDNGTTFETSWAPGTRILINKVPFTIYRVISNFQLELVENAGSQLNVEWRIDEPTILAQPMPCLWEWDNYFFACGDDVNPGRLYYSNRNSETTRIENYLDLTSPSEPLMNGLQYNIRSYVFSSENFIQILQTGNPLQPFRHEHIPNGKGLFSRWALTREPAPYIDFLAKDGVYRTVGGSPVSLTKDDMFPLFPFEGNLGGSVNGIASPNVIAAQETNLRIAYYDGYSYFDFAVQGGGVAGLVLASNPDSTPMGWFWDVYTPNVVFHYGEEGPGVHSLLCGGGNEHLYQYSNVGDDDGTAFSFEFTTPSRDQNDPRANKLYGDIMLDADTDGLDAICIPFFNNNASSSAPVTVNTASRIITPIPLGDTWVTARNISLNVVVSIDSTARPIFYIWEPRWTFESAPISAFSWEISPTMFGMPGYKHIGLCKIAHVSNANLLLTFIVDGAGQSVTIPSSGGVYAETIVRAMVLKGKMFKVIINSASQFRLDTRDSFIEVKQWGSDGAYQQLRVFGDYAMIEG